MRPAEPPVDAEQLDPVGVACEDALSVSREPDRRSREEPPVAERRWGAMRHSMREAYVAGRDAEPLMPVIWEDMWKEPLAEVREAYRIHPLERRWLD